MNHQFQIRVHSGELRGQAFVISQPEFKIGRDPSCDIVLGETAVSRIHAIIYSQGVNTLVLADNNSTNGTAINSVQVTSPVQISENDVIVLGGEVALALEKIPAGMGVSVDPAIQSQAPAAVPAPAQQIPPFYAPVDSNANLGPEAPGASVYPAGQPAADPFVNPTPQFQSGQPGSPNPYAAAQPQSAAPDYGQMQQNPYGVNNGDPNMQYGASLYPNQYGTNPYTANPYAAPQSQFPRQSEPNPMAQYASGQANPGGVSAYPQQPPVVSGVPSGFDPMNPTGLPPSFSQYPYAQQQPAQGFDPNNPYAQQPTQGFDPNNPYAQQQSAFAPGNPYGQPQTNPYGQQPGPYGYAQQQNPYAQPGPYGYPDQGYGQQGYDGAEAPVKSKKLLFIILGIVLAVILIIVVLILYVDANYLWCDWFPFLWSAEACQNYPPLQ